MSRFALRRFTGAVLVISTIAFSFVQPAAALSGSDWRAGRIIDDGVFYDKSSMSIGQIQQFLNAKLPACDNWGAKSYAGTTRRAYSEARGIKFPLTCLKDYHENTSTKENNLEGRGIPAGAKSAANIIWDAAQQYSINPQVLIVLLQKEQSLVLDDWPWPIQFRSATGYGCPDTAACDSEYYGFYNQVQNAARQFRRYANFPNDYNHIAGHGNNVRYNPNAGCGSSNVFIDNVATASLYNYTPYQPNQAALNNLYGTGDSCSSYGNRNFWRIFNEWFGSGWVDGYTLAYNEDDNTQWVIYRGVRQYVPNGEIKRAWGLPDQAIPMSSAYLGTIPQGPSLGRLFHLIDDPTLYFADNGKKYRVTSLQMRDAWGFSGQTESFVSRGLWDVPQHGGDLTYAVKNQSNPALYAVDGTNGSSQLVLRQYASPDVFHAWEGDADTYTVVSDEYFNTIDNAVGSTLTGYTIKGSGATQYHVVSGQKLYLSGEMAAVFNRSYHTVSDTTLNRLVTSAPVSHFVRLPGNGVTIYMAHNGQKHAISSLEVLKAWLPTGTHVNILNQGFLNLLTTATPVSGFEADVSGQLYVLNGKKISVPSELDSAYRTGTIFTASAALMNTYTAAANATGFIKGDGPAIYLLDEGTRRHIPSIEDWLLWNGTRNEALTKVSEEVLAQFSQGSQAKFYFTAGGNNYVADNGTYHSVSSAVATDWGLSGPASGISTATRDRFTAGAALSQKAKVGSTYYRVKYGKKHMTQSTTVADIWGVSSSPVSVSAQLVALVPSSAELSIFAKSSDTNDKRIFLVDNNGTSFYHLTSLEQFISFGYGGGDFIVAVPPADLGTVTAAKNIIKTAFAGSERIVDAGQKHPFSNTTVKDRWVNDSNALTVSDALWSYFAVGPTYTGNIKGSTPHVYTVEAGQKRWIQSGSTYQTYALQYGQYVLASDLLLSTMQAGTSIP